MIAKTERMCLKNVASLGISIISIILKFGIDNRWKICYNPQKLIFKPMRQKKGRVGLLERVDYGVSSAKAL